MLFNVRVVGQREREMIMLFNGRVVGLYSYIAASPYHMHAHVTCTHVGSPHGVHMPFAPRVSTIVPEKRGRLSAFKNNQTLSTLVVVA